MKLLSFNNDGVPEPKVPFLLIVQVSENERIAIVAMLSEYCLPENIYWHLTLFKNSKCEKFMSSEINQKNVAGWEKIFQTHNVFKIVNSQI